MQRGILNYYKFMIFGNDKFIFIKFIISIQNVHIIVHIILYIRILGLETVLCSVNLMYILSIF